MAASLGEAIGRNRSSDPAQAVDFGHNRIIGTNLALVISLVVAFLLATILAAAEVSLLRLPSVRAATLAAGGDRRAQRVTRLLPRMTRVLNAILLAALLTQIAAATLTGILADRWFGSLGVTIASIVLTLLLFIYAEAIPKTYAVRHPEKVALALSGPVAALEFALRPVVTVLVRLADLQIPGQGVSTGPTITEDELKLLAMRAAHEGEITEDDVGLIERAFRFGDRHVDDVMVPRTQMVTVSMEATIDEATRIALEAGHRRLPVYGTSVEEIIGMVRLRDLVQVPEERRLIEVRNLTEEVPVVPETKRILELLREMQSAGRNLAIVVDEYGGTAGLVTIEDIVEELLGSISDEAEAPPVVEVDDTTWSVDGALPIEDLSELLGTDLGGADWNTAAGYVLANLGQMPSVGDTVEFEHGSMRVVAVRGRRITRIEVTVRR